VRRYWEYIAIAVLGVFIVWKGIIPALTTVDTDFPNYYTSSRLLLEGKDMSRLYDDQWFQEQINAYGIEQQGKFAPFPPVTAVLMIPLALLPPLVALRVWTVCNISMCVAVIVMLCKISGRNWQWRGAHQ
jgi:hypothetical protein